MNVLIDQRHMLPLTVFRQLGLLSPDVAVEDLTVAQMNQAFLAFIRRTVANVTDARATELTCYVNHGRWVADCPNCNAGIAAWPKNPLLYCAECATVYSSKFPAAQTIARATDALAARSPHNRNWYPQRELTTDLEKENRDLGLSIDRVPLANEVIL